QEGGNKEEGDALAQILAIHLLRNGKYAVYPRTMTLEQVQSEYDTQQKSGVTRADQAVKAGQGVNPRYALSVISRKIGTGTRFNAAIIDINRGVQQMGGSERYTSLSDGIDAMDFLARELSGQEVSETEREKRSSAVVREKNAALRAAEAERRAKANAAEAERRAKANAAVVAAATDNFLKNSGIFFGRLGRIRRRNRQRGRERGGQTR
ncbi:MAG: hypothetical protein LBB47_08075, partial [Spirochaetaceae bacterium]|nr:hypothetical protein [Spirochaetaceae bacterium]